MLEHGHRGSKAHALWGSQQSRWRQVFPVLHASAMQELQPLLDLLQGNTHLGFLPQLVVWIGALRIAAKPFSAWLQILFTRAVLFVQVTPEHDDDAFVERLLANPFYRLIAFTVDLLASIKLPNSDSLRKVYEKEGLPPGNGGKPPAPPTTPPAAGGYALAAIFFVFVGLFSGCARFSTTQKDIRYDDQGKPLTEISTHATASTLFTAKSQLTNFKAAQSEKTQGASVGSLTQESTGTNAVRTLEAIAEILKATK